MEIRQRIKEQERQTWSQDNKMGSETVLIGASVVAALSIYIFFKLLEASKQKTSDDGLVDDAQKRNDPLTTIFALVWFGVFLFSIFLVSKASLDGFNYCSTMPVNSTVFGSLTNYDYERVCFENTNNTGNGFFKLTNFTLIACSIFLLIAMLWNIFL